MADDLIVREATPDDAAGIVRVHIRSWQGAYAHAVSAEALRALDENDPVRVEQRRAWLRNARPRAHTLVALSGDEVVGFADGAPSRDDDVDATRVAELFAIYVAPDAWGTGAGRRLMAEHLERLRASGFEEAVLWVLDDNPRARRFYEVAGWATDGAAKDYELLGTTVRLVRYRIDLTAVTTG
jgi:ribosomal protein S18 acetylase RimI-like enzyme